MERKVTSRLVYSSEAPKDKNVATLKVIITEHDLSLFLSLPLSYCLLFLLFIFAFFPVFNINVHLKLRVHGP